MAPVRHHFRAAFAVGRATMMFQFTDPACDEQREKEESYHDEKPGNDTEDFSGNIFFPDLHQQERSGQDGQKGNYEHRHDGPFLG